MLRSVRWLERQRSPAPIEFLRLLERVDHEPGLGAAIDDLLALERASPDPGHSPRVPPIQKPAGRGVPRVPESPRRTGFVNRVAEARRRHDNTGSDR